MKQLSAIVLLCLSAFGQTTYSNPARYSGAVSYGNVPQQLSQGENAYCTAGAGTEKIEGTPSWGSADGVAQLPTRCINTAVASTPSPGATINVAANDSAGLTSALASVQCGQTIQLTANSSYTAPSGGCVFPALACDGAHWITIKSFGVSDANFPAEGVRATPCIAGISNDATNGYNAPGYPSYSCPSYPSVLTAKLLTNTANQPAIQMASGANHYRFIGLEITKQAEVKPGQLVSMTTDGGTQGANHVIFDRVLVHGQPWTMASTANAETQAGINVNNTQWFAFINSWNYDTYCNGGCVDSQAIGGGTGAYASGPFKVYNNLLATSGESLIFGGGGQGIGTPNPQDLEARANHSFKPLVWMIPIEACGAVNQVVPKNLGEFKNVVRALLEGNVFENSWQGCQSDQTGFAFLLSPKNQNNKASIVVNFDGSATATRVSGGNFIHSCGNNPSCSPADAANCPPGGCILEVGSTDYRFCNGSNGCSQAGDLVTTATLTTTVPAASGVAATTCVPGDCPSCKVQHVTFRLNEVINTTQGLQVATERSSHCLDEASGMSNVAIHDNVFHGLSQEMANGSDPYQQSTAFAIGNGQVGAVINNIEIGHNTVAVETQSSGSYGGLGSQTDHTDLQYLSGFNIRDNISPAAWHVLHSQGSSLNGGLAANYPTNACRAYYPNEAPGGLIPADNTQSFTFSPSLASYIVTLNGVQKTLTSPTSTSFSLSSATNSGDAITIRDLTNCNWTFRGNLLGTSLPGSGRAEDPYPASNNANCGTSGTAACILDGAAFTGLFSNWQTRTGGNYAITSSTYQNSASDAGTRPATGKNPGADLTTQAQMTQGVRGTTYYPALTITTAALPSGIVGTAYQGALQASAGASPYKGWWLETNSANCGGNCGSLPNSAGIIIGRSGTVNGPFIVLTASRATNISSFTPKQTIVAGAWQVGQTIALSGFVNGTGTQANDGSFNGTCVISAVTGNNFSCPQTGADISSHSVKDQSVVSFAPVTTGTYTFWMGARDGAFQQAWAAITITVAVQGGHAVDLNWNPSSGATSYTAYRSATSGSGYVAQQSGITSTFWTDTNVTHAANYYYVVTASNANGESLNSNEAAVTIP